MKKMHLRPSRSLLSFCLVALSLSVLLTACKRSGTRGNEWMHEDDVPVAIDETFQPIFENMVKTFAMMHPEANMQAVYVSEDSALRMLVNDSINCCIATRKLSDAERDIVKSHRLDATQSLIASDAIALITSKGNADSLITLDEIKGIVSGRITRWEQLQNATRRGELSLVFDASGSSTVRFMKDSLCNGADLKGNVYASEGKNAKSVIETVQSNPNVIGIVGANWLMTESGEALSDFSSLAFNVMRVSRYADERHNYVRPYQFYIGTADYPLLRSVYIIHTDPRSQSMLRNFYFFTKGQKGQTIICNNSQMLPITPVTVKKVSIK